MIFPQPNGVDIRNDHQTTAPAFATPEQGIGLFRAGGAISPGVSVMTDVADNTGKSVIARTVALQHLLTGIYEGTGGTGAPSSAAGFTSKRAAVTGDPIWVVCYGPALALAYATTTLGAGSALQIGTPGILTEAANPTAPAGALIAALQAVTVTSSGGTALRVIVKAM
jgi:hypothetical protein